MKIIKEEKPNQIQKIKIKIPGEKEPQQEAAIMQLPVLPQASTLKQGPVNSYRHPALG